MRCGPRYAGPACPAIPNARWRGSGMGCRSWCECVVPALSRDPHRVIHQSEDGVRNLRKINFCGYGSRLKAGTTVERRQAVTASTRSSSSKSSSIGAKVESGLVESVIGLRLPEDDGVARAAGPRDKP